VATQAAKRPAVATQATKRPAVATQAANILRLHRLKSANCG
jgi:hypothetical protein